MKKINYTSTKGVYPKTVQVDVNIKFQVPDGYYFREDDFSDFLNHCIDRGIFAYSGRMDKHEKK